MQYCFEHLKHDGKDILEKGVKDEKERALLEELVECLRFAMTLRRRETGKAYGRESRRIRNRILEIARTKVKDGAVAGYFDIFRKKRHRLFQWVAHPEVPAENNLAERRLVARGPMVLLFCPFRKWSESRHRQPETFPQNADSGFPDGIRCALHETRHTPLLPTSLY